MRNVIATVSAATLALCLVAGCCKRGKDAGGDKQADNANQAENVPNKGGVGIENSSNNEAVVKAAREAIKCEWSGGFSTKCEAYSAFTKLEAAKTGAEATFLNFLEDADEKVQFLGLVGLNKFGRSYKTDKQAVSKLLGYVDKIDGTVLAGAASNCVAGIHWQETGALDRIKTILVEHKSLPVRRALVSRVLFSSGNADGMYDLYVKLAKSDNDKEVRRNAAGAFWTGTPQGKHDEVCKLWLELVSDPDDDLAGHSAYHCAFWTNSGGCTGQWDELLNVLDKKAKAGEIKHGMMGSSLRYLYKQKNVTDAQKKRVLEVAKEVVKNPKNNALVRSSMLKFIGENDPAAKAFAAKYKDDPESFVQSEAAKILVK